MPSSIFNSNYFPSGMVKTWGMVIILTLSVLIGWELYCRQFGLIGQSVSDTGLLWAKARNRASLLGKDAIILLGASRIQLGIDLKVLQQNINRTPVQLAIDGSSFIPVLEDLSHDSSIKGIIIISTTIESMNPNPPYDRAQEWIALYHSRYQQNQDTSYHTIESSLTKVADKYLATRAIGAKPYHIKMIHLSKDTSLNYLKTLPNRQRQADYYLVQQPAFYEARMKGHLKNGTKAFQAIPNFKEHVVHLKKLIEQLKNQGAKVVLVRLPTSKEIWEIDNSRYPKHIYWDYLAKNIDAPSIHFQDYPALTKYNLPDGSHLDYRDAPEFTKDLVNILISQDILISP